MNENVAMEGEELTSAESVNISLTVSDVLVSNENGNNNEYLAANKQLQHNDLQQLSKGSSKPRRLGNIFKIASVRGAKSKSMKHKLTTQFQPHVFKIVNSEKNCEICQKALLNKKTVECKSKQSQTK